MNRTVGIFLAGAAAAYLLDPASGQRRRASVNGWARPVMRRLRRAKDTMAKSDALSTLGHSVMPTVVTSLKDAANTVQSGVVDAASTVAMHAGAAVRLGNDRTGDERANSADGTAPAAREDYRAEVAPGPGIDPIPEGATNDPTLVSRVESELFRDGSVPKGNLNIDAANGVVTLRGTLDDDALACAIVERTHAIEGVAEVIDLLRRA